MSKSELRALRGAVVEDEMQFSVVELCRVCAVRREVVIELVHQGILEPTGASEHDWKFPGVSLRRTRIAVHLQRDLGVNTAGAALALQLMEEIERLRVQLGRNTLLSD